MAKWTLPVPKELFHPYFFPGPSIEWDSNCMQQFVPYPPFIYEAAFYNGIKGMFPWKNPEKYIPLLVNEWKGLKEELVRGHSDRDSTITTRAMRQGIALFLEFIYWSNGKPVKFPLDSLDTIGAKPVNVEERLEFIMARPGLYHSYIQLSELINEQQKQFARLTLKIDQAKKNTVREQ